MPNTYKVLASGWNFFVDSIDLPGTWIEIKGINSFDFGGKTNSSDVTTFDSGGQEENIITSRSKTLKVEGLRAYDGAGVRDAGQTMVERLSELTGDAATGNFKLVDPKGNIKTFKGQVTLDTIAGGGNKDGDKWAFSVGVMGAVTDGAVSATSIEAGANITCPIGQYRDVQIVFTPANTTNQAVTAASATPAAAHAIGFGSIVRVKGIAAGSSIITVTTADGSNKTDTFTVTVS